MASITIRNLDDKLKQNLRVRAAQHGRSMEDEARNILRNTLGTVDPGHSNLAEAVRSRFASFGGIDIPVLSRESVREPPSFGT